jgi:hypothetical protein
MPGFCEHGNELYGSVNGGELLFPAERLSASKQDISSVEFISREG